MNDVPLKAGMHYFPRMISTKSVPVVVTIRPGRLTVVGPDGAVIGDGPTEQLRVKYQGLKAALRVEHPGGTLLLAALASASSPLHTPEQRQEIEAAQEVAAREPALRGVALAHGVWIGENNHADGTRSGSRRMMANGELGTLKRVGTMAADALVAAGAHRG